LTRALRSLLLALALGGCVAHPVGPARTFGKYESKARTTATSALSEVQTAMLVADTASDGRAFGPYTSQVLGDAEESLGGLAGTFGSIQPPSARADAVRDDLTTMLGDAEDHVAALRIAVRRGVHDLDTSDLDGDVDALESFLSEHGACRSCWR
jgi:hypothetical protein